MKIHGSTASGNCLKVAYLCDYLGLSYDWVDVDIFAGGARTPAFRALHPAGQVPVLELDDGRAIAQSNAILLYLGEGSSLIPDDLFTRAQINEWLFWEQYSHEPYIAVCHSQVVHYGKTVDDLEPWRVERGTAALARMDDHLSSRDWFVGDAVSVADIALLAYSRVAYKAGFDMDRVPAVKAWIDRCAALLSLPA